MPNYMDYTPSMSGPAQNYTNRMQAEGNAYSNRSSDMGLLNMMAQQHPKHALDLAEIQRWLDKQRMDAMLQRMLQGQAQGQARQSQQEMGQQGPAGWQSMPGLPPGGNGRIM